MNNTLNKKICLSKRPVFAIVGFIISFIIAITSIIICFLLRYKYINYSALIFMECLSLLFCICLYLMVIFNILGRKIIVDFEKHKIVCKKILLCFSISIEEADITNLEIVEKKKGKKVLVINNVKYESKFYNQFKKFLNPFKIEYNEKNVEIVNEFIKCLKHY